MKPYNSNAVATVAAAFALILPTASDAEAAQRSARLDVSAIAEYVYPENEEQPSDGKLLEKAGIKGEDVNFKITFDLIIETESEHKFKSNITLDLPTGNILQDGIGTLEDTQLENVVFKRL